MRMDDFEKRWQRIQDQLRLQASGEEQPRFSSGRTLFGIRSEAEERMDELARQIEEEQREKRQAEQAASRNAPGVKQPPGCFT